ncbi:MAG: hypothetical protein HC871_13660 [Rhizobiales bacterium]|nr:hypothetical protein [Hyphomicrobiales bacterium]
MQKRKLGSSGIDITALVLGGNVFGWTVDEARSFDLLDRYVAVGGNWGGQQGVDPASLPYRFEIDYVRVYQTAAP